MKKGTLNITDYLAKLENLAYQYVATCYIVQDENLIMYALIGLGSDYDAMVRSITTWSSEEKISLKEVYSLLLNHESIIEMNNIALAINSPSANFVKNSLGTSGHGKGYNTKGHGRGR